jgi:serine O-acetyltransferase
MIKSWSEFLYYIKCDQKNQNIENIIIAFILRPISRFIILLRFNEYLINTKKNFLLRVIPLIWYKRLGIRLGFSVPFNVFQPGLAIVHYGLLIVNPSTKIGKNCRIHAGVNIGASAGFQTDTDTVSYAPTIGDNCYIGPGAKIFGPIEIGHNCVIGANAVVNKNFIKDGITIGGIPATIISNKGSEGKIINVI